MKKKSRFFKFKKEKKSNTPLISEYSGWNGSKVIKIKFRSGQIIDNNFIVKKFSTIANKEKILVITSGHLEIEINNKKYQLKKFDSLSLFSDKISYKIKCVKSADLYLISSKKLSIKKIRPKLFNFKRDVTAKNLWGGKCISRPYLGKDLNLVLFNLKPGFKFDDKGHLNEQITWLIKGKMNFYSKNIKGYLNKFNGVDVGPYHQHGGISRGAVGFDAFFPKRKEKNYKQLTKTIYI